MSNEKTVIITGASGGIGTCLVAAFLKQEYRVVATSLNTDKSFTASPNLILVDGNIAEKDTAARTVEAAIKNFGAIDVLIAAAGIYRAKPFTEFTREDFNALVSVNLLGFIYITQLTVQQMLKQKSGSVVSITSSLADSPIAGINASVSMITKGGLNSVIRNLAIEYAKDGIRFNAVAPGVVDTNLQKGSSHDFLKTRQPMGRIAAVDDIVDAVLYLVRAGQVTGEILHVDGGAHAGKW
jgi:NAD(P)-dependent dehydrogenase (short-subunit alcohol dehydrogenase family)